jgi:hypothetical protein
MAVCVLRMTDQVLNNDARWQNVLFQRCCYRRHVLEVSLKEIKVRKG